MSCGLDGQLCCADGGCATGLACTSEGRCGQCGAAGEACCAGDVCDGPIVHTCSEDRCLQRSCDAFETLGFVEGWAPRGHCGDETWECAHDGITAPRVCVAGDDTPMRDGFGCAECVMHQWLSCSVEHGCARQASELLCCWAARCPDARYPCSSCDEENEALGACNLRDPSGSYCDRFFAGGAISRCF
ncbi:MAG: hypothetical protein J0L92_06710 [Deltaproteobacteria bacterium]|nr:hypothetical protein [Deltaproteobacteria bacterium]